MVVDSVVSGQQFRMHNFSDSLSEPSRPGRQCVSNEYGVVDSLAGECLDRVIGSVDTEPSILSPATQLSTMVREPPKDGV